MEITIVTIHTPVEICKTNIATALVNIVPLGSSILVGNVPFIIHDPANQIEKYKYKTNCRNCGKEVSLDIPKGTTVSSFAFENNPKCHVCGCPPIFVHP